VRGTRELNVVLNYDADILTLKRDREGEEEGGVREEGRMGLARLRLAIKCKQKKVRIVFVVPSY